ncbi:glucan biosynthesis protein [Sphingomonas sp. PL-96]|uniref:glucan biosynthesis protein n=1 Tax=Sphingomonas sp. PL-96 TaxID=2887201 RepID=UPI001E3F8AC2|nr:glucan biosynthesis protein [Sphingomonas sp. PL-96]MCC2975768.1 glucan biosynthesis protein [Sphingomonas sp. PL-96]
MRNPTRREIVATAGLAALFGAPLAAMARKTEAPAEPFSWELLQQRAAALATQPYRKPERVAAAADIDYDAVGSIRYRPQETLAGGIRLFPLGRYAPMPVKIHIVENGQAQAVPFSRDLFEAVSGHAPPLGIAGFRAMVPGRESDWMAFQGASYFRTAGSQDQYGLSARGVAINTGISGREEFPDFTEFWIERTAADAYTVYALMDGESVTGAYRIASRHQNGVQQDVSAVLHLRRDVERLGIAPATSMFWYGEGNRAAAVDWRPEIHDSDGLALLTGRGERIWRPLVNPPHETLDSFADEHPRGFGLLQRDRNFDHYQDDGAFYDRRPNLWVEPRGQWGRGNVMLFAFPTAAETVDNIVSFWVPAEAPKAGQRLQFDYGLRWGSDDPTLTPAAAHVVDSWTGVAGRPGDTPTKGARKLVVDYEGEGLAGLDRSSGVSPAIEIVRGRLIASAAYPIVGQKNRWRVTADIAPEGNGPADVRLFLKRGERALSETLLFPVFNG